jgi:CRISPR system Cascade subunit CasC
MFVELHILQNFAPSNLNRDDTNAPKECEFGGVRRARISSQCLKRAVRTQFDRNGLLPAENRAVRTKRLLDTLVQRFEAAGKNRDDCIAVAETGIGGLGLAFDKKNPGQTEYLLFLGQAEIDRLVEICLNHWDALFAAAAGGKGAKSKAKEATGAIAGELSGALDGGRAADLALFGRMLADIPNRNVDAASQVAHAISTHKVGVEFDFFTAVDDLRPETTEGAGMMGTVEFNSACFYRYANVDVEQLSRNLAGDRELTEAAVHAFIRASIEAIPTGKQNSMAAHNPPSLVFAVVRRTGLQNLANAFARPVYPRGQDDLIGASIIALDSFWHRLSAMYGVDGVEGAWVASTDGDMIQHLAPDGVVPVAQLIQNATAAAARS